MNEDSLTEFARAERYKQLHERLTNQERLY